MPEFRRNHTRQSGGFLFRLIFIGLFLLILALWWGRKYGTRQLRNHTTVQNAPLTEWPLDDKVDQLVQHKYYSLGYNEASEQASWVAYRLTREDLIKKNVPRTDWFEEDPDIWSGSSRHSDYSGSGFTRGHLVPAGDMAFSEEAMEQTFYMSNISPQKKAFNGGIWRELEESVRDWAMDKGVLYVITGPVLKGAPERFIGKSSKVRVPDFFYKVIFSPPDEAVGFVLPNVMSTQRLTSFMMSVDEVEDITGIDFLKDMVSPSVEEKLEANFDDEKWSFDEDRYQLRVEQWNNR